MVVELFDIIGRYEGSINGVLYINKREKLPHGGDMAPFEKNNNFLLQAIKRNKTPNCRAIQLSFSFERVVCYTGNLPAYNASFCSRRHA